MQKKIALILFVALLNVSCSQSVQESELPVIMATFAPTPSETATIILPTESPIPQPTNTPAQQTPTETPTPQATDIPRQSGSLMTEDSARVTYTVFGTGDSAVIFSNMSGSTKGEWRRVAEFFAANGLAAITYDYREGITNLSENAANGYLDLQAVYTFAINEVGVQEVFLIGASMGGPITVHGALGLDVAGIALISAPIGARSAMTSVEEIQSLDTAWLFVNTRNDDFYNETIEMHDAANDPKTLQIYSGNAHGTGIFTTEDGEDLLKLLLDFVLENSN